MTVPLRDPVSADLIRSELPPERFVRAFRGIEIYSVDGRQAPAVMEEIGRIREREFRAEGGGTGKASDIDEYDTGEPAFRQLVAWDPEAGELIGMYRYLRAADARRADGSYGLPTARLFEFSPVFCEEVLPYTIELGRSVVNRSARRAIMGLFCVWAGLGALVVELPECRYFFGKFTTYPSYHPAARAALFRFLGLYCADPDCLVYPREALRVQADSEIELPAYAGTDYEADYELLRIRAAEVGEAIPPLVISYLALTRSLRCFGTARNPHFGNVLESAILVPIADIGAKQRARFIASYESVNPAAITGHDHRVRAEP